MKKSLFLFALVLLVSVCSPVLAQTPEQMGPPPVLLIVREDIKAGKMPAHSKHSASYAQAFAKLQTPNHRIALVPVAGNENEVVYITGAGSFAEIEKMQKDADRAMSSVTGPMKTELDRLNNEQPDLHSAMRDMLTVYRPELSFKPGVDIAQMRYFSITTVRVRPGHDAEYVDYIRSVVNVARDKAKVDNFHLACFQVISGAPGGTYMFFRPMKSLGELDQNVGAKVRAAMSDDMKKAADKANADAVIISEGATYAFEPSMSYVPKEMAARDPGFWNPKPEKPAMMMKKRVKKPAAAKAAGAQPPAKQ
jgi:hypothetical protein